MASKLKDMRRADLIEPYKAPPNPYGEGSSDVNSTMASTMPMAAMFLRNKSIGWAALSFAVQTWLTETPAMREGGRQPAYFGIIFSLVAILVCYMPGGQTLTPTGTGAPPAQPAP